MADDDRSEVVIPVVEEKAVTDTRTVKRGAVRVDKRVETDLRNVDIPLMQEEVEIRRVPVNRVIDQIPDTREDGDTVIIPVAEEEVVITKRLVLKEEIHISKRQTTELVEKKVELKREHAEVKHLDSEGRTLFTERDHPGKRRSE